MGRGLKRIEAVATTSEATGDGLAELVEMVAQSRATEAEGAQPKPGSSARRVDDAGRNFATWMADTGIDVDKLKGAADLDAAGEPKFPAPVLASWLSHRCATSTAKPRSIKDSLNKTLWALKLDGWAVAHVEGDSAGRQVLNALSETHAQGKQGGTKRARPVLLDDHESFLDVIDFVEAEPLLARTQKIGGSPRVSDSCSYPTDHGMCGHSQPASKLTKKHMKAVYDGDGTRSAVCLEHFRAIQQHRPLARMSALDLAVTRYWITLCWTLGLRAYESAAKLRWGMFDLATGELEIPGGLFKWQGDAPEQKRLPHRSTACVETGVCVDRCIYAETARYRQVLDDHGIPTGPNDSTFPAVRSRGQNNFEDWVVAKYGDADWFANPLDTFTARYEAGGVSHGVAVGKAISVIAADFQIRRWKRVVQAAGHGARHDFECPGTHGMRRGFATQLSINGVSHVVIAQLLGHNGVNAVGGYIERQVPTTTHLLVGELPAADNTPVTELPADVEAKPAACEVEHKGVPCGRGPDTGRMTQIVIDDKTVLTCKAHYLRQLDLSHRAALTGDSFTRPIGVQDGPCEVEHKGVPCGRGPDTGRMARIVIDDKTDLACEAHYARHLEGKTGDDFTRPIKKYTKQNHVGL